jgi:hypothetical protein
MIDESEFDGLFHAIRDWWATPYRLRNYRTMQGREGQAWSADITLGGKAIGDALDDGNGGMIHVYIRDLAQREAFEAEVARVCPGDSDESFAMVLQTITEFDRKRNPIVAPDEAALARIWFGGSYIEYRVATPALAARDRVRRGEGGFVWVKGEGFKPVAEVAA